MNHDAILHCEFAEVDDLTSRLRGMAANVVPLHPRRYAGTLSTVDLGDITLQIVRSAPVLFLGASTEERVGLIQVLEGSERARWNGRSIEANEIAVCGNGTQHQAIYLDEFAFTVLSFTTARTDSAPTLPEFPWLQRDRPDSTVHAGPDAHSALAEIARGVEQAVADTSSVLRDAEARRSLRATALDTARGLLSPADVMERPRARDGRTRQRIVREADEYLSANPARPVYTDELCTALGTSASRLHQAFYATFSISPHRYLKMRRMSMVRTVLLSRSGPWHSVKAAALSHGFWHLGQFAHDYRAMYGEAPSETLARGRPGTVDAGTEDDG
jgi:AraC family ethanolamine operon transcriptional activator